MASFFVYILEKMLFKAHIQLDGNTVAVRQQTTQQNYIKNVCTKLKKPCSVEFLKLGFNYLMQVVLV